MFELDTSILEPLPKGHYWIIGCESFMGLAYLAIYKKRWWGSDIRVHYGTIYKDTSELFGVYYVGSYISEYVLMMNSKRIAHEYDVKRLR